MSSGRYFRTKSRCTLNGRRAVKRSRVHKSPCQVWISPCKSNSCQLQGPTQLSVHALGSSSGSQYFISCCSNFSLHRAVILLHLHWGFLPIRLPPYVPTLTLAFSFLLLASSTVPWDPVPCSYRCSVTLFSTSLHLRHERQGNSHV